MNDIFELLERECSAKLNAIVSRRVVMWFCLSAVCLKYIFFVIVVRIANLAKF